MYGSGFSRIIRHITLYCPGDGTRLKRKTVKGVTVNCCPMCGGCFFDQGEFELLIDRDVDESMLNDDSGSERVKAGPQCPRCDGDFKFVEKKAGEKLLYISACKDCGGIWLVKGMYQKILSQYRDVHALLDHSQVLLITIKEVFLRYHRYGRGSSSLVGPCDINGIELLPDYPLGG